MCLALPMQVKSINGYQAICEVKGVQRDVSLFMLDGQAVSVGDHVLVHLGYAIQKLSPEDAFATWELLDEISTHA